MYVPDRFRPAAKRAEEDPMLVDTDVSNSRGMQHESKDCSLSVFLLLTSGSSKLGNYKGEIKIQSHRIGQKILLHN